MKRPILREYYLFIILFIISVNEVATEDKCGVDVIYSDPFRSKGDQYLDFMLGCYNRYNQKMCDNSETSRMSMNRGQPPTQFNYTKLGFEKVTLPEDLWRPILTFWNVNKDKIVSEDWAAANTYVNHWSSPTYLVSFDDSLPLRIIEICGDMA